MNKYFKYFIFSSTIIMFGCSGESPVNISGNGELNESFNEYDQNQNEEWALAKKKHKMIADGWSEKNCEWNITELLQF